MGKITVKHYLNTNLKPYIINGAKYYTIYALVTASRQNTKVKSKAFNEYYTENDFIEINNPENKEDYSILKNEEIAITNIANLLMSELDGFDTTLFAAVYNYFQSIYIFDIDIQLSSEHFAVQKEITTDLYNEKKNKLGLNIDNFFTMPFSMKENQANGMSIYTWFSLDGQINLKNFLVENNCKYDIDRAIEILNKIVYYRSFKKLNWIFRGSKKYEVLNEKYSTFFDLLNENIECYYKELSI